MDEQLIIRAFYRWAGWNAPIESMAFAAVRDTRILDKLREVHDTPSLSYTEAARQLLVQYLDDELLAPIIAYVLIEGGYHNQYRSDRDGYAELGQDVTYPKPSSPFSEIIYSLGIALRDTEFPEGDPEWTAWGSRQYMLYLPKWCMTIQQMAIFKYISIPCRHWTNEQFIAPTYSREPEIHLNSVKYMSLSNAKTWADLAPTALLNHLDDDSVDGLLIRHNAIVWQHAVNMSFKKEKTNPQSILQMHYAALALLQSVLLAKLAAAARSEKLFPTSTPFTHVSLYDGQWVPFKARYNPDSSPQPQGYVYIPHHYVGSVNSSVSYYASPIPLLGDGILVSYTSLIDSALLHESSFGLVDVDDISNWGSKMIEWIRDSIDYPYNPRIKDLSSYLVRPINIPHPQTYATSIPGDKYIYQVGVQPWDQNEQTLPLTTPYMRGTVTAKIWRRQSWVKEDVPEYFPTQIHSDMSDFTSLIEGAAPAGWPSSPNQVFRRGIYAYPPKTTLMPMVADLALIFPHLFSTTVETPSAIEALTDPD
jgi:hypothetical protein